MSASTACPQASTIEVKSRVHRRDELLREGHPPFTEAKIKFAPTYKCACRRTTPTVSSILWQHPLDMPSKYDVGTQAFDTSSKQRAPAWTDRVLWSGSGVHCILYDSVAAETASDHKPVVAKLLWE